MNLKDIVAAFIRHRHEVIIRRSVFELKKDRARAHKLEGFMVALNDIDEIIKIVNSSQDRSAAKVSLMAKGWNFGSLDSLIQRTEDGKELCRPDGLPSQYGIHSGFYYLSDIQADAILDLQLHRLTHLEKGSISEEYGKLVADIRDLLDILGSETRLITVIKDELIYIRNTYGDDRRTEIQMASSDITKADLIAEESAVITISHSGYVKYQPLSEYQTQKHGGRGRRATKVKDEDVIDGVYVVSTHDTILCFTSIGRVYALKVYDLPRATSSSKGHPIVNLLKLEDNEKVQTILPVNNFDEDHYLFFATKKGFVKKTRLSEFANIAHRRNGLKAIVLGEDDSLVNVAITYGKDVIGLFTRNG